MWRLLLLCALLRHATASDNVASEDGFVLELDVDNFDDELSEKRYTKGQCLIEFYASWCPHCQHYKPTYEKIGRFFNAEPRPKPYVWVARIDCGKSPNWPVCDKFNVKGYPTIYLGPVEHYRKPNPEKLTSIAPKPAVDVVTAINKKLQTDYVYEEKTVVTEMQFGKKRREKDREMDLDDIERATVELFDWVIQSDAILDSKEVREGFVEWVELLSQAHPSKRCRRSSGYLKKKIESLWPEGQDRPSPYLKGFHMCTIRYKKQDWGSCAGSTPENRGYTCGLWQLLHALTVGVGRDDAALWVSGVRAFARYFFGCAECAKHFLKAMDKRDADSVSSRKQLILWLWETHNTVNARLRKEEEENQTADPSFPKVQWPTPRLCPNCQEPNSTTDAPEWKEQKILKFLEEFYGPDLNEEEPITGRKELLNGQRELTSTDVFSKADAKAVELQERGRIDMALVVFIIMVLLAIYLVRNSRRRKIIPISKDIL